MTTDEALQFLREHQPLPPTEGMPDDLVRRFDEVRKFFIANPDERCVELLLNSFGAGDAHGVYQLVEDTILAFPDAVVVAALQESLRNPAAPCVTGVPRSRPIIPARNLPSH